MAIINKPADYFNTKLAAGTGSAAALTGIGFQPDLIWSKIRTGINDHRLVDAVRGTGKEINSNLTNAENTNNVNGYVGSFDTDGFNITAGSSGVNNWYANGNDYVYWNWLGANGTVSNTNGSITSTVSANTTSGFSVVSYTGNATVSTIGHGLSSAPKIIIVKNLGTAQAWPVDNRIGSGGIMYLSQTDGNGAYGDTSPFPSTAPTSTVFSVGTAGNANQSGQPFIAYCFTEVQGYSKISSYTGNGSADGPFIYTGHKPAFILLKRTDVAKNWYINDNLRDGYNNDNPYLSPNITAAETGGTEIDILSNGFKIRAGGTGHNASGGTYIYMAIAENPFVSNVAGGSVPVTAR